MENNDEFAALSKSLEKLDQSKLFEEAFNYVKNKKKVKIVTIGMMINSFLKECDNGNKENKFALGWTALAMMKDRKENLLKTIPEDAFKKITQSIIEKICE